VVRVAVIAGVLDKQVPRSGVAVHQAPAVRRVERPGGLAEQEDRRFRRQPPALLEHLPQVGSRHVAHRDAQQPAARPGVVNGDDIRVIQHVPLRPRFLYIQRVQ
jgi:hypothetical protein